MKRQDRGGKQGKFKKAQGFLAFGDYNKGKNREARNYRTNATVEMEAEKKRWSGETRGKMKAERREKMLK